MDDPFPEYHFSVNLGEFGGMLLRTKSDRNLNLYTVKRKEIYKCCAKALNKDKLNGKVDTVWRESLAVDDCVKPVWRVFYKAPLNKRTADLQWRILHGAVSVNAFISVINPDVSHVCSFCGLTETIFHCFTECKRLENLFELLENVFNSFNEKWSKPAFIFGAGYRKINESKWKLLNFIIGQAKLAIYTVRAGEIMKKTGKVQNWFLCLLLWLEPDCGWTLSFTRPWMI